MARKMDHSEKRKLAENKGTLWLEMASEDTESIGKSSSEITDEIVALIKKRKLGKYDGRSVGSGGFDVSFDVKNREAVAVVLRQVIKENFPKLRFSLSDEYQCVFDTDSGGFSLEDRLESLEQMAEFLVTGIAGLREALAEKGFVQAAANDGDEG